MLDYREFVKTWLERAKEEREVDKADRFICLWIALNASLKQSYAEKSADYELIKCLIADNGSKKIFDHLNENDRNFKDLLVKLKAAGKIYNMRFPNDGTKAKEFLGDFKTFIEAIYQIRCNLFHGRKDVKDDRDKKLVFLAYDLLLPWFLSYCKRWDLAHF